MRSFGNPNSGLLRRILEVIYEHGQEQSYDSDWITRRVEESGYWGNPPSRGTHERTVNSYFAQNPQLFEYCGPNCYRLRMQHFRLTETPKPIDDAEDETPPSIRTSVYRTLRETDLVKKLKQIHQNRCQICGLAISIGDGIYSEGHHIRPLGRRGPDIAGNILVLCPNHHVQCDYGGIRLILSELRAMLAISSSSGSLTGITNTCLLVHSNGEPKGALNRRRY